MQQDDRQEYDLGTDHRVSQDTLPPLVNERLMKELDHDTEFLRKLQGAKVDNRMFLIGENGKPVDADLTMTESEFVNNWLDGFTLGIIGERSYFPRAEWFKITNYGGMGVAIVDDNDHSKVLFIIAPVSSPKLTPEDHRNLAAAGMRLNNAKTLEEKGDSVGATELIGDASDFIAHNVSDERRMIHEYVPRWFYEKYGIMPEVRQLLIYCRDYYGLNSKHTEDWAMATEIFERIYYHEPLTEEHKRFMSILTNDTWEVPVYKGEAPKRPDGKVIPAEQSNSEKTITNPFEA